MSDLTKRFTSLKKAVGGNRERMHYEETFGMPREEFEHITPPNPAIRRILAELEFALRLSSSEEGRFDAALDAALALLEEKMREDGVLTKAACLAAEELLMPLKEAAKAYKLILAGHAHIDMNWMWSWHETVAATLATFRTMIDIMEEYPEFCFSQSQASVYEIVERFDPELADEIKKKIAEGRWEVTASAWVETDKNMPNTESLLRHIQYTKKYLRDSWGISPDSLEIDFSPDTFGHSAHLPELDRFGGVKYYYHCRALDGDQVLYRWRSPSGKELLCYREPYWYNSGITPRIGPGVIDLSRRSAGFKTGLIVYGVGDHGGGPTRRDVERALEMQTWPIFPTIRFGTFREFFHEAEAVREKLPIVEHELNYFAPGCYTTQSRIKMGNRASERALLSAETMSAMTAALAGAPLPAPSLEKAWRDVLFTHFHDILTGSCVQDSREHAMGLYSEALAAAQSSFTRSLRKFSAQIDTSAIRVLGDKNSQAEGAGSGYGVGFTGAMPRAERGCGLTRIFTVVNPTAVPKREAAEITVWDWTGDLRRVRVTDAAGNPLPFQKLDGRLETYWDHKYFRVLVYLELPPCGYTTVVLEEKEPEGEYPFYYQGSHRTNQRDFQNFVLENEYIRAEFASGSGELVSLKEKDSDREYIRAGKSGGFRLVDTERATSNAWCIGNYLKVNPIDSAVRSTGTLGGPLRSGFYVEYKIRASTLRANVTLDRGARAFTVFLEADWHETGGDTIPVLTYEIPLSDLSRFCYDVPAGHVLREAANHDVPGLQYGAALPRGEGKAVAIVNESKYGYRGTHDGCLITTFLNSSTSPDPYPERGIHSIRFSVGLFDPDPKRLCEEAAALCGRLAYQPAGSHTGSLPSSGALFDFKADTTLLSAIEPAEGGLLLRLYNTGEKEDTVKLAFQKNLLSADRVDLMGKPTGEKTEIQENSLRFSLAPYSLTAVYLKFRTV